MLTFVSEAMPEGAVAALYANGRDIIVLVNSEVTDPALRCDVVNRLLARLSVPTLTSLRSEVA